MGVWQGEEGNISGAVAPLGLHTHDACELATEIQDHHSFLEFCRVDPKVASLVAALHTGSWFAVGQLGRIILTARGGRQG